MRSILEVGSEQLPAFIIGKEKVWDIMKWKYHKNMCFISAIQKDVLIKTKSIARLMLNLSAHQAHFMFHVKHFLKLPK